ncbi:hypothetical protein FSP39_015221 [Pinctada imbricata]|uniref:Zonadhesin n=1 Tax=Pinctada imbricata TaxID=66713 RepID=A0AA88XWW2_PINIB|nr:hypothetical protein FSP39_015221 [Pinctada imbricata]
MGTCSNTLTRFLDPENPCFLNVEVKLENRRNITFVSFVQSVRIEHLGYEIYLLKGKEILIEGEKVSIKGVMSLKNGLKIRNVGKEFIEVVSTACDIIIRFDGRHMVNVMVPKVYADAMTGICGDCNGIKDDLKTADGTDVSDRPQTMYREIGDSYIVEEFPFSDPQTCKPTPDFPVCKGQKEEITNKCKILLKAKPFKDCISAQKKTAKQIYRSCKIDICANIEQDEQFKNDLVCNALEELEQACLDAERDVEDWREYAKCPDPKCGPNESYEQGNDCERTCNDEIGITSGTDDVVCAMMPARMCLCKEGFVRDDNGSCIRPEQCVMTPTQCTIMEEDDCKVVGMEIVCTLDVGESVRSGDCRSNLTCGEDGLINVVIDQDECDADATCVSLDNGDRRCICNSGFAGNGFICNLSPPGPPEIVPPYPFPLPDFPNPVPDSCPKKMTVKVTCASINNKYRPCEKLKRKNVRIIGMSITQEHGGQCSEPGSYGFINDVAFVNKGCDADFKLCLESLKDKPCERPCSKNAECVNGHCKCKEGFMGVNNICRKIKNLCTCSASGSINYLTYDGKSIHFNGECGYKFTEYRNKKKSKCNFVVKVKNKFTTLDSKKGKGFVTTQAVVFRMKKRGLHVRIDKDKIMVNGKERALPVIFRGAGIYRSGSYVRIYHQRCGVLLSYDMDMNLVVSIDKKMLRKLSSLTGICGNCNDNQDDETSAEMINKEFGTSKKAKNKEKCENKPCESKRFFRSYERILCKSLNWASSRNENMKKCFEMSPHMNAAYQHACLEDSCSFTPPRPNMRIPFFPVGCSELEMYAFRCRQDFGLKVNWRKKVKKCTVEDKCGENMEYRSQVDGCPMSCGMPSGIPGCRMPEVAGCTCKHGYWRDGDKCVQPNECGEKPIVEVPEEPSPEPEPQEPPFEPPTTEEPPSETEPPPPPPTPPAPQTPPPPPPPSSLPPPTPSQPEPQPVPSMGATKTTPRAPIVTPEMETESIPLPTIPAPPPSEGEGEGCSEECETLASAWGIDASTLNCKGGECICSNGQELSSESGCEIAPECECPENMGCDENFRCVPLCICEERSDCAESNAKCNQDNVCECLDGYSGEDPSVECLPNEGAECQDEDCINGQCDRSMNQCVCNEGFEMMDGECQCPEGNIQMGSVCVEKCSSCPENEQCNDRTNECECKQGFIQMGSVCVEKCSSCPENEQCNDQTNECECKQGFIQMGSACVEKCSSCPENEQCNDQTNECECIQGFIPMGSACVEKCSSCPENEQCNDQTNECECKQGFIQMGSVCVEKCSSCPENEQCNDRTNECECIQGFIQMGSACVEKCSSCPENQHCNDLTNECECNDNFFRMGDSCVEKCSECQDNAHCNEITNNCECDSGFMPMGESCIEKCRDENCKSNEECKNNQCVCKQGFMKFGDACEEPCRNSMCPDNAACGTMSNKCECTEGFTMVDGKCEVVCTTSCHRNGECINGACQCKDGYQGDGVMECKEQCGDDLCHEDANCAKGKCKCNKDKPYGNGVDSCSDTCGGEICNKKAECVNDKCACKLQFYGDGTTCKKRCGPNEEECDLENGVCQKGSCMCKPRYVGNGLVCNKMCTCSVNGDPTYNTFDGASIRYMGHCKYTLSKYDGNDGCDFNVEVKNDKGDKLLDNVARTKYVEITIYGIKVRLGLGFETWVDGKDTGLPFIYNDGQLTIKRVGTYVIVESDIRCGVTLRWNGNSVAMLTVPQKYSDKLSGLCGNCDGTKNDLRTKEGEDVSKDKAKFSKIGNSYLVKDEDAPEGQSCEAQEVKDMCNRGFRNQAKRNNHCGNLLKNNKGSPFKKCMQAMPEVAKQYYDMCEQDYCANRKGQPRIIPTLMCNMMEAFSALCEKHGIKPSRNWRTYAFKKCQPKCPKNSFFRWYFNSCHNSCGERTAARSCKYPKMEGCYCRGNFLLSDGKCVRPKDCGCTTPMGGYVALGDTMLSDDCSQTLQCAKPRGRRNAKPILLPIGPGQICHPQAKCGAKDGKQQCMCMPGFKGDGVEECKADVECSVDEDIKDCVATTKLSGECYYKSKHNSECDFRVVMTKDRGQVLAYVMNGTSNAVQLIPGDMRSTCADFSLGEDNMLEVKEKICDCPSKGLDRFKTNDVCVIKEKTLQKDCKTIINLEGECFYKSKNRDCKYTTVIVSERGQDIAYLQFKGESEEIKLLPGDKASGCANVKFLGESKMRIVEKVCDCVEENSS